ncbi:MAG: hypothetical protein SGI72_13165 [Planctomycetota bacterium]|nr:hypothetical protein [Planctomycetota bacterium]
MSHEHTDKQPTRATPEVDRLLARLRAKITSNVFLHGFGTAIAFAALWLLAAFLLDWALHLPGPIRIFHLGLLTAIPAFFLWRDLVRPLARRPNKLGLAVVVERAQPELNELFSSAVQMAGAQRSAGEPELVAAVITEAERKAPSISLEGVLDPRGPRRRAWFAAGACALVGSVFTVFSGAASVFLARLAGADVPWPQRTHLSIEVPTRAGPLNSTATPGEPARAPESAVANGPAVHKVARGSDVPIVVRAEGLIPDEVVLHFSSGHKAVLAAGGGAEFRTLLPSVQEDVTIFATGGDDQDEEPQIRLLVLQPPDVAGLAVAIRPPTYTKLSARLEFDRDVEVVAGSKLSVHVLTDPADATGHARLVPEDRVLALVPAAYPLAVGADPKTTPKQGLAFELDAHKSLRYRFELVDATGLSNPDPGLFGVTVLEDRAPEVELLSPGRGDFDTVATGALPLRARAEDDFGIATVAYSVEIAGSAEGTPARLVALPFVAVELDSKKDKDATRPARAGIARAAVLARARLEIADLAGGESVSEGRQFQLQVIATDVCEPQARDGRSSPLRVRVVSIDEYMRRLQDRLSRCQTSASALAELARDKQRRLGDLVATLESDSPEGTAGEMASALTGQRRVLGDARALMREICSNAESVLYARVDERALAALDFLDERLANQKGRGFDPEPWRELGAASKQSSIAGTGLAGKLIDIGTLAVEISEDLALDVTDQLTKAGEAVDIAKAHEFLLKASDQQKALLVKIDLLLERLAEWDNFQSVLSLTRDILNAQKGVSERTRAAAKEK